jgi:AraC-like DNA-binding protein
MENHLFSAGKLAVLRNVEHWRFVASGLPEEVPVARHCKHDAWARRHIDVHPNREVLVVLGGAGYQSLCGRSYPARPGTVFFFDAMEPHDLRYSPTHPSADHLWFHFMPDRCSVSFLRVRKGRGQYRSVWHRWYTLPELGLSAADALFPGNAPSSPPETVRRRCAAALALLVTSLVEKGYEKPQAHPKEDFHSSIIQTIVRHIHESHGRGCRLESLARIAGYSKYHFLRLFQKHTGASLQSCVTGSRVQAFRKMAAAGTPLRVMSSDLGFAFPSALCRWRRRQGI